MSLKFTYVHGRPMLTAKLQKDTNTGRYFDFLIDSGADYTLISKFDACLLGIEYENLTESEIKVEVANASFINTKKTSINIFLGNEEFSMPILIAQEEVERLLGRKGIFSKFNITFKEYLNMVIFNKVEYQGTKKGHSLGTKAVGSSLIVMQK